MRAAANLRHHGAVPRHHDTECIIFLGRGARVREANIQLLGAVRARAKVPAAGVLEGAVVQDDQPAARVKGGAGDQDRLAAGAGTCQGAHSNMSFVASGESGAGPGDSSFESSKEQCTSLSTPTRYEIASFVKVGAGQRAL